MKSISHLNMSLAICLACWFTVPANAQLPNVSSGQLIAHFTAESSYMTFGAGSSVSSWTAANNAAITLNAGGTNDPNNIVFDSSGMGGLGTVVVNDFSGDNRYLQGSLGHSFSSGSTIFWTGFYDPGRGGSLGDGAGQYAYSLGRAGSQGSQMDHQIDDGNFELYGGSGTQTGSSISYLNSHYSVWQTNYLSASPGHEAFANEHSLGIPADGGYNVGASENLLMFGWQNSSGTPSGYNFVGNMSDFIIYDGVLSTEDAKAVNQYLANRLPEVPPEPPPVEEYKLTTQISGLPNEKVPGFVPHGNPNVTGTAELTIYSNNTMDYKITLDGNEYEITQAHLYNINETSGTSGNPANGDSIICWGGRWENGGDSDDFLVGTGFSNSRLQEVLENPEEWMLIVHTEGGHFAADENGGLVEYDPLIHETNELGVSENERPTRFNNRVGRTLLELALRQDNINDPNAPFYDPNDPENQADSPFVDANGKLWVQFNSLTGNYELTQEAIDAGYDLETEYLFYLYDDQGPVWDFGGPEGAFGGFLSLKVVPEPTTIPVLLVTLVCGMRRRKR